MISDEEKNGKSNDDTEEDEEHAVENHGIVRLIEEMKVPYTIELLHEWPIRMTMNRTNLNKVQGLTQQLIH